MMSAFCLKICSRTRLFVVTLKFGMGLHIKACKYTTFYTRTYINSFNRSAYVCEVDSSTLS